jgi:NADH:ubiquinone oxidoreductase subunit E
LNANHEEKMVTQMVKPELEEVIRHAFEHHGSGRDALIPVLAEVNSAFGHIPARALDMIAQRIHMPENQAHMSRAQVYGVASFYQMFSTKELGEHVVRFCESAPCHVVGGREVFQAVQNHLGIKPGQTTPDAKWSLVTTSCLGICSVGPVFMVDEDVYGNVTPEQVPDILGKY